MEWIKLRKEDENALIRRLYIEPTSRCNLSCKMCFRHKWIKEAQGDMSGQVFDKVTEYLQEHSCDTVFFGGMGEPLICGNIAGMVGRVSGLCRSAELLTNATLLNEKMSADLINNGLGKLWISMDGFSKEEYEKIRLGGRFELISENIRRFNELRKGSGTGLGITFVVMEENVRQLEYINGFAEEYSVDELNISHAIPMDANAAARDFYETDIAVGKMRRYPDGAEHTRDYCPFVEEGMCFVKWDGEIVPCMQLLHSSETYMFDIRREVCGHSFGNVKNKSLFEIYNSTEYRGFRENVLNFDFPCCTYCEGCELRESNLEDCMFNQKPTCGACLWATGKVFCP